MKLTRDLLFKLSEDDDEDAFDPMDFSLEDLDELEEADQQDFIKKYKDFYDDVKTGNKFNKNDW